MKRILRCIPLICITTIIITASSQKSVSVVQTQDLDVLIHKLAHITEYAALYISFIFATYTNPKNYVKVAIIGLFFTSLFGLSDEMHQTLTQTRSPRISDIYVDTTGGIVGYVLTKIFLHFKRK